MEPLHIPDINRHKAALVRTKLLIQAHQRWLVQYVKQLYNMGFTHSCLYFTVSESSCAKYIYNIFLHKNNQILLSVLCPGNDIIGCLEEHVYCEILDLNTQILDTLPEEEASTPENMMLFES